MDWIAKVKRGTHPHPDLDRLEKEYLTILAAWWKLDTDPDSMTMDDTRRTFDRLDELYRSLRSNGRNPPIRLPIERNRAEVQRELAL